MERKYPSLVTSALLVTLLLSFVGELFRLKGFLLLDLFIPFVCGSWIVVRCFHKKRPVLPLIVLPALLFWTLGLGSLLIHSQGLSHSELIQSALYGVRWLSFFGLSVLVLNERPTNKTIVKHGLFALSLLLALAGFIQLKIMPDFSSMEMLGWDPHQDRLLSTWFDPNFVGGFFAFMIPLVLGEALDQKNRRWLFFALAAILTLALLLTLSRGAYLAFLFALLVFGIFRSLKMVLVGGLILALAVAGISPVQDRFLSLWGNAKSVFTETYTLPDASARFRFGSWKEAWELFEDRPFIGQGYNRYKYAAIELGTLDDPNIHSAGGSDSSLLNVLATTGILGFMSFMAVYTLIAITAFKNRRSAFALGFFSALSGLFIHSIFVNSLLFPLFMAPFWISAGLILEPKEE